MPLFIVYIVCCIYGQVTTITGVVMHGVNFTLLLQQTAVTVKSPQPVPRHILHSPLLSVWHELPHGPEIVNIQFATGLPLPSTTLNIWLQHVISLALPAAFSGIAINTDTSTAIANKTKIVFFMAKFSFLCRKFFKAFQAGA